MEIKYLQTFRTIVTSGGFAEAARQLNYTQSAITFQVGQLEEELGTRLFEKIGRRMLLTKAGERFVPYADEVLGAVAKMQCFSAELQRCRGELRVGVAESILCYKLPPLLKLFYGQAPQVRLYLQSMNCYDIRDGLLGGQLDMGIFYEDIGGFGSSLRTHALGEYPLALVAAPETAAAYPDFCTPDRRLPLNFIINEKHCVFRELFEDYLERRSIILAQTTELWSIPTIINLVKNNAGISYLPRFAVQQELARGELQKLTTAAGSVAIHAVCAYHKNKWISPPMQLFLELAGRLG